MAQNRRHFSFCKFGYKVQPAWNYSLKGIHDAHHEKTDLKVFVAVIHKEGLAGWGPTNPSLGMTSTTSQIK